MALRCSAVESSVAKAQEIFSLACSLIGEDAKRMRILRAITVIGVTVVAVSSVRAATGPLMKAAVLQHYGGPEVLKLQEVSRPEPKDDEVLVRVIAAGVNPVDAYVRQGRVIIYLTDRVSGLFCRCRDRAKALFARCLASLS